MRYSVNEGHKIVIERSDNDDGLGHAERWVNRDVIIKLTDSLAKSRTTLLIY